jgi:hypothetical protein
MAPHNISPARIVVDETEGIEAVIDPAPQTRYLLVSFNLADKTRACRSIKVARSLMLTDQVCFT